jgi:hypothetical protein
MPKIKIFNLKRFLLAYSVSYLSLYIWILNNNKYQYTANNIVDLIVINTLLVFILAVIIEFIVLKIRK